MGIRSDVATAFSPLPGHDYRGADLASAGARYHRETIWPDGFLPEEAGAEPM